MSGESGPTQGAERHEQSVRRWEARPRAASAIRLLIVLGPLLVSLAFTVVMGWWYPPERLGIGRWTWVGIVFLAANMLMVLLTRLARRLTPLAALMALSLVFPDQAPARSKAALRRSSSAKMLREVQAAELAGVAEVASLRSQYLAQLLRDINEHDRLTRGHSERVRAYAELLGEELGVEGEEMHRLRWGALLHDVGKLDVPAEILNSDGRPTDEEWAILRTHPENSAVYLEPIADWLGEWANAASEHHARYDGGGYPEGLAGEDISFAGRLVAVADAYDVMTSARSYKAPLSHEIARQELTSCAGDQFDPKVVNAFLRISLGDLRSVAGPLAWLTNLSGSMQLPGSVASTASTALTAAATGVVATAFAFASMVAEPIVTPLAFGEESPSTTTLPSEPLASLSDGEPGFTPPVAPSTTTPEVIADPQATGAETATVTDNSATVPEAPVTTVASPPSTAIPAPTTTVDLVTPNNASPIVNLDEHTMVEDAVAVIDVLANDVDPDGDSLVAVAVADPANGTATLEEGKVRYTPNANYFGVERFEYTISDGVSPAASGQIVVDVIGVRDAPIALGEQLAVFEDQTATLDVSANDIDHDGDTLTWVVDTVSLQGATVTEDDGVVVYTPAPNFHGEDSFSYGVSDGESPPTIAVVDVVVSPVQDAPTIEQATYSVAEVRELGSVVATLDADDVDGDELRFNIESGDPTNRFSISDRGELILEGALDHESQRRYVLTVQVSDDVETVRNEIVVEVTDEDEPPSAEPLELSTPEDNSLLVDLVAAARDPEGKPLTAEIVTFPEHGSVSLDGSVLHYVPDQDFAGSDAFTYVTRDPRGNVSPVAVVDVTVEERNDVPIAEDDDDGSFSTEEEVTFTLDVRALLDNDSDVDDELVASNVDIVEDPLQASAGTLTYDALAESITFTPARDFVGTFSFGYRVSDGRLHSNMARVAIEVTPVNDAPTAREDRLLVDYPTPATIAVRANDTDVDDDGDDLTVVEFTDGDWGSTVLNPDGSLTYTPTLDTFATSDSFTYVIEDRGGLRSRATVEVTILSPGVPNSAPTVEPLQLLVSEGTQPGSIVGQLNVDDVDGDPLTITIVDGNNDGLFAVTNEGLIGLAGPLDFETAERHEFVVEVFDGRESARAAVVVNVDDVNESPMAVDDLDVAGFEDTVIIIDALGNDSDPEGDPISIVGVSDPELGTASTDGSVITYVPDPDQSGRDTFEYTISDGKSADVTGVVGVQVLQLDDPPYAKDDGLRVDEDTPGTVDITALIGDVDGDELTWIVDTRSAEGGTVVDRDGVITYTPPRDFYGDDSFTYVVSDGTPTSDATATINVSVNPLQDAPTIQAGSASVLEGSPLGTAIDTIQFNDVDDDPLTFEIVAGDPAGDFSVDANGTLILAGSVDRETQDVYELTVEVSDGIDQATALFAVEVTDRDEAPVARGGEAIATEDLATEIDLANLAADPEGQELTFSLQMLPQNGSAILNGSIVTFLGDANFAGSDAFTFTARDRAGNESNLARIDIDVMPDNDAPTAVNDEVVVNYPASAAFDIAANDTDIDEGDELQAVLATDGAHGTTTVNPDGTVTYHPTIDANALSDSFTYTVQDKAGERSEATVSVTIVPPEDGDGVDVEVDLCPFRYDPFQLDADEDLVGDVCDPEPNNGRVLRVISPLAPLPTQNSVSTSIIAGDVNNDGSLDLVVGKAGPDEVFLNDGSGLFSIVKPAVPFTDLTTVAVDLGDFDGDGDLDLVAVHDDGDARLYLNDGAGRFGSVAVTLASPAPNQVPTDLAVADVNEDGNLDVVITRVNSTNAGHEGNAVYFNNGVEQGIGFGVTQTLGGDGLSVAAGVLDESGTYVVISDDDEVQAWSFEDGDLENEAIAEGRVVGLHVADVAGDDSLDVLLVRSPGGRVDVVVNPLDDDGSAIPDTLDGINPVAIDTGDVNGDGLRDIVSFDSIDRGWLAHRNFGDGLFERQVRAPEIGGVVDGVVADLNGDGRDDVVTVSGIGEDHVYVLG